MNIFILLAHCLTCALYVTFSMGMEERTGGSNYVPPSFQVPREASVKKAPAKKRFFQQKRADYNPMMAPEERASYPDHYVPGGMEGQIPNIFYADIGGAPNTQIRSESVEQRLADQNILLILKSNGGNVNDDIMITTTDKATQEKIETRHSLLEYAVKAGSSSMANWLVSEGAALSSSVFKSVIERHDQEILRPMISVASKHDLNCGLVQAALLGRIHLVNQFLEAEAEITDNSLYQIRETAPLRILELFVERGAKVATDSLKRINWDWKSLKKENVEFLLEHGADPNISYNEDGIKNKTPLYGAVEKLNSGCVSLLVKYGADVNAQCQRGVNPDTIFKLATRKHRSAVFRYKRNIGDRFEKQLEIERLEDILKALKMAKGADPKCMLM